MCYKIHPLKCPIQWFLVYSAKLCSHHHIQFRRFVTPQRNPPTQQQSLLIPVAPCKLIYSVSMDLSILDIAYKWNIQYVKSLCLAS